MVLSYEEIMSISYVLIRCEVDHEELVMNELKKIDSIKEMMRVMGSYDVVVKIEEESPSHVKKVISSRIRTVKNIKSTITLPTI